LDSQRHAGHTLVCDAVDVWIINLPVRMSTLGDKDNGCRWALGHFTLVHGGTEIGAATT
jgi:hypothetical protein